jgi:diacylglycerol kinase
MRIRFFGFNLVARTIIALRGLVTWVETGYIFLAFVVAILLGVWFSSGNWFHLWIVLILGAVLIVSEIVDTAVEHLCDAVDKNFNSEIKIAKDLCAGAVLLSAVIMTIVAGWIIISSLIGRLA